MPLTASIGCSSCGCRERFDSTKAPLNMFIGGSFCGCREHVNSTIAPLPRPLRLLNIPRLPLSSAPGVHWLRLQIQLWRWKYLGTGCVLRSSPHTQSKGWTATGTVNSATQSKWARKANNLRGQISENILKIWHNESLVTSWQRHHQPRPIYPKTPSNTCYVIATLQNNRFCCFLFNLPSCFLSLGTHPQPRLPDTLSVEPVTYFIFSSVL